MHRVAPMVILILTARMAAAIAGEPTTGQQLLPPDTLAYAGIADVPAFRERWKQSSFGAMQEDPEFEEFLRDMRVQLDEWTGGLEQTLGLSWATLWEAAQGELSLGLIQTADQELAPVAVIDFGDNPEAVARLMRTVEDRLAAEGGDKMTLQAEGAEMVTWTKQHNGRKQSFSYTLRDGHLVLSNRLPALMETIAGRNREKSASFAASEEYRRIIEQASPNGDPGLVRWYADPLRLVDALLAANLQGKPQMDMVRGFLNRIGLDRFEAIGGTVNLATGEFDSVARVVGHVKQPSEGLLEAFRLPASRQRPPEWVSEDVSLYAQMNWSFVRAYQAVGGFFDTLQGPGAFDEAVGSMPLGQSGLKLKEDLVDQLVGPLHIVADVPESVEDATRQPALFALGVRDADRMAESMGKLAESIGGKLRTVEGETIYEFSIPSVLPGKTTTIGTTVASGSLMVSTDADFLAGVLRDRGRKRPLAESLAYRRVAEQFPEETSMISFQRQDKDFESLYESIRSGELLPRVPGVAAALDFSKLPRFDVLRRYLQSTGSFIEPTPDGFRLVDFALPPRER